MSAASALRAAREVGLTVAVDGDDLALTCATRPPAAVLDLLGRYKAEVIATLTQSVVVTAWQAEDWQAYFDERAGILEYEAGLPRPEAEARAFEDCVAEWLVRHHPTSPLGRCPHCGSPRRDGDALLPFGTTTPSHAWLHRACWSAWRTEREETAVAALARFGIVRGNQGDPR